MKKKGIIILICILLLSFIIVICLATINTKKINLNCSNYSIDDCPDNCVICPPCEVCSSISCQTEEYCKDISFDKEWYDSIKP
jgi:hypothetical protein